METFDSPGLPTGPKDGGRGRKRMSPVWSTSDDSSVVVSGLENGPDDELVFRDGNKEDKETQQQRSVLVDAFDPSPTCTARSEPGLMSFGNRLRR